MLTHLDTRGQLQDVNLAEVVTTAQAQADGADGLPDHLVRRRDDDRRHRQRRDARRRRRSSRSSTPTPPTGRTASPAGRTRCRPTSRSSSASSAPRTAAPRRMRFDMGTSCGAAVRRHPGRPAARPALRLRRQLRRDLHRRAARARHRRRPAQRDHAGRRPVRLRAGVRPRRDDHGRLRREAGRHERPQPRRADLGPLQPRRRGRAGRRPLGLVAGGLPARDDAQPRRRAVGRAALDAAARPGARRSTATAGRAPTSCVTPRTPAPRTRCSTTAPACPARSRRTTTAAATTTSTRRPAPGSYLATHWNTYDSAFLAPCGEIAPACGGGALWVPEPPGRDHRPDGRRHAAPRLDADRPRRHLEQRARPATPTSGSASPAPAGRTSTARPRATYLVTSEDLGRRLRVTVVASNPDGSAERRLGPDRPGRRRGRQPRREQSSRARRAQGPVKAKTSAKKAKAKKARPQQEEGRRPRRRPTATRR